MGRNNKQRIDIENGGSRELTVNEGIRHAQITEAARRVGKVGWTVYAINPGILNDTVEASGQAEQATAEANTGTVVDAGDRFARAAAVAMQNQPPQGYSNAA